MKRTHTAWLAGIMIFLLGIPAAGRSDNSLKNDDDHCTAIAVGRLASVDGSVIGSQDGCCTNSRLHVVPARDWPPGSMAPVYDGLLDVPPGSTYEHRGEIIGEIPQVPHTYAYLHSGYPHMNERQLMIAESTLYQRPELVRFADTGDQIMTIEQAQLFALQRCRTARDAVKLIGSLVEEYGFRTSAGPASEGLLICDPQQVWLLEVCSIPVSDWKRGSGVPGAIWAAQRIPDDHIIILANTHVIRDIDLSKPDLYMGSANYKQAAIDMGLYDPAGGEPFRFYEAYGSYPVDGDLSRLWLFYSTFVPSYRNSSGRDLDMKRSDFYDPYHTRRFPMSYLPLSAKPDKPLSVQDGKGGFVKSPLTTPFPSKDWRDLLDIPNNRQVAKSTNGYGFVGQVRSWLPDWIGGKYWFYVSNQYVSTFAPVYAGASKISLLYSTYNGEAYQPDSAWWAVRAVFNVMHLKFRAFMEELKAWRDPLEQRFLSEEKDIEAKALELYKRNPAKAQEYLTGYTMSAMKEIVDQYHNFFWHLVATGYSH